MKAILLAAGLGTRLRPITENIPKCLVPIHGKPLLAYWLEMLFRQGVSRILINTHHLPRAVRQFVANSEWRQSIDLVHEEFLLGTGGTVLKNRTYFADSAFLVAHADNLTRFDVAAFIRCHENRPPGVVITMMTFETDTPQSCGIVETSSKNIVMAFHEKVANPPSNRANAAVYIFESTVIDFMETLGKSIIDISTEVLPNFLGRIHAFHNADYHRDIGTPESLRLAEIEF